MEIRCDSRTCLHAFPGTGRTESGPFPVSPGALEDEAMEPSGTLFRIERLAVHDGPGIRTVLFFKGCPLRCAWCSTPESQRAMPETLYTAEQCTGCGDCITACPQRALSFSPHGRIHTDRSLCTGAGLCVEACRYGARKRVGGTLTLDQILEAIEKDEIFYHRSGGGITLSGGEPLLQPAFAGAVLAAARMRGISTAVETCGHFSWKACESLGQSLDLVYVDIKHTDPARHKELTGKGNEVLLANLQRMDALWTGTDLVVRVPLIPGINDDRENLQETAAVVQGLDRVTRVELLPYHRYGAATYARLGRAYPLEGIRPPSKSDVQAAAAIFTSQGIPVQIGG